MTLDFLNGLYGKGASTSPTNNMASSTSPTSLSSPAITPTTASSTPTTPPATQPTTPQMPKINGALSPTLNDKQIRENIDYMLSKGIPKEQVQAYVNNYKKGSDGNYVLNTPTPPATQPQDVNSKNADAFNKGGQEIISNIKRPSEIADAGGSPLAVGRATGEAGLRTAGTVAGTTLKLITNALSPYVPNFVKEFLKGSSATDANANPYLADHVKTGLITLNDWVQKHPEAAKDLDATGNIMGLLGLNSTPGLNTPISEVPGALKTGVTGVVDAGSSAASAVGEKIAGPKPTIPEVVGKITQAEPGELPSATRALGTVDTKGVKTFKDLGSKLDETIKGNTAKVDTALDTADASGKTYKPTDVTKDIEVKGRTCCKSPQILLLEK